MVLNPNGGGGGGGGSARSLHDAASVVSSRIHDAVASIQRPGLRESWDSLVRIAFAPCAGDVGGIPREELGDPTAGRSSSARSGAGSRGVVAPPSWGASVPFEVSASQDRASSSLVLKDTSFASSQYTRDAGEQQVHASSVSLQLPSQQLRHRQHQSRQQQPAAIPEQRAMTPHEQRQAQSRAKLRQLGAQHQLAGGHTVGGLADAARPISPGEREQEELQGVHTSPAVIDFDDGISAISSHTLEEMERRRQARDIRERKHVVRLHPLDFTQIVEEGSKTGPDDRRGAIDEEASEKDTEVVFGDPFCPRRDEALYRNVRTIVDDQNGVAHDEFVPAVPVGRVASGIQTQNTTLTEESHEFEEMLMRHEAMYWADGSRVADTERGARDSRRRTSRPSTRGMSIEERARRLRELSRSRSRSDGTGSSNKSGASSLISGQHPHDTVPVYSSDLFTRRKKSSSGSKSRRSRSIASASGTSSVADRSDTFSSSDYGEI